MAQISHWHILGAGSMGCLWAYYLAKAGHQVSLIVRDTDCCDDKEQIIECVIDDAIFTEKAKVVQLQHKPAIDNLLICLKAHQTPPLIAELRPVIKANTTIVLLQNGLGNQELIANQFSNNTVYAAVTTEAALSQKKFKVKHTGKGQTSIGPLSDTTDVDLLEKISCALHCVEEQQINKMLWEKLIINCCINPLSCVCQCKNGALANNKEAIELIEKIVHECIDIAKHADIDISFSVMYQKVITVINKTAENTSSMRQDVLNHRKTEIDYMNGYMIKLARQHSLASPVNAQLTQQVKSLLPV